MSRLFGSFFLGGFECSTTSDHGGPPARRGSLRRSTTSRPVRTTSSAAARGSSASASRLAGRSLTVTGRSTSTDVRRLARHGTRGRPRAGVGLDALRLSGRARPLLGRLRSPLRPVRPCGGRGRPRRDGRANLLSPPSTRSRTTRGLPARWATWRRSARGRARTSSGRSCGPRSRLPTPSGRSTPEPGC